MRRNADILEKPILDAQLQKAETPFAWEWQKEDDQSEAVSSTATEIGVVLDPEDLPF